MLKITAPAEVRNFCESISLEATKNITLLRSIEQSVNWLSWLQDNAQAGARYAGKAADHIKMCDRVSPLDVDGTLCALFEQIEQSLERIHQLLVAKRDEVQKDPNLNGADKGAVVDEYLGAIRAIADLHGAMTDLRWAVGEHDADLEEPMGPSFGSPGALKEYLASL